MPRYGESRTVWWKGSRCKRSGWHGSDGFRSLTLSLIHSLNPSLPHFLAPSLPHALTPSLPHSLTPSLPHSLEGAGGGEVGALCNTQEFAILWVSMHFITGGGGLHVLAVSRRKEA